MPSVTPILEGDLLAAFAAFADTRNFTHAARRLGLSQPAFFERIRRLSDALGVPLYERQGKQIRLTAQGLRLSAHAREALVRSEACVREIRGEAARETVTLAAGEGAFLYFLGPALTRFVTAARGEGGASAREPAAALRLLTLGTPAACEAVRAGEAQLAVGVVDLVPEGLVAADVLRTPLCVAMSRRHPLARRRALELADLAGQRLILPPPGRSHRDFVGRAFGRIGQEIAPPIEADGWPLMLQFAAVGLGVAVVNGICVPPRGVVLRPVPELGTVCYRLITRRGAEPSPAAARLAAAILALGAKAERG